VRIASKPGFWGGVQRLINFLKKIEQMTLPDDIKQVFFETINGNTTLPEFEQWVYSEPQLEQVLTSEDYLNLISFGFNEDGAKYALFHLLLNLIDMGEYETWKLLWLLHEALKRNKNLPEILMTFYDMYCREYNFLDNLGLGYGLAVEVPLPQADSWDELTHAQQEAILDGFYPEIEQEILKVISWIDNKKIVLTGNKNSYYHYEYIDNRTEEEKLPTAHKRQN